jgi:hypothetical protein
MKREVAASVKGLSDKCKTSSLAKGYLLYSATPSKTQQGQSLIMCSRLDQTNNAKVSSAYCIDIKSEKNITELSGRNVCLIYSGILEFTFKH